MSAVRISKLTIRITFGAALVLLKPLESESAADSPTEPESSVVDANGVRRQMSGYGEGRAPWVGDMVKFVQPN